MIHFIGIRLPYRKDRAFLIVYISCASLRFPYSDVVLPYYRGIEVT